MDAATRGRVFDQRCRPADLSLRLDGQAHIEDLGRGRSRIIISEIMYHSSDDNGDGAGSEYIEIYNPTDDAVDLDEWQAIARAQPKGDAPARDPYLSQRCFWGLLR